MYNLRVGKTRSVLVRGAILDAQGQPLNTGAKGEVGHHRLFR